LAFVAGVLALGSTVMTSEAASPAVVYSGSLLVDKSDNGRFWYVNPVDRKRYELGFAADEAISVLKDLALGISEANLKKIPKNTDRTAGNLALRRRLSGRMLLAVESDGALWYVRPKTLKRVAFAPDEASFRAFTGLAAPISHVTLSKIPIGFEFETGTGGSSPTPSPTPAPAPNPGSGCGASNVICSSVETCVNGACVPTEGCQNNNPGCYEGQTCTANACVDIDPAPTVTVDQALQDVFGIAPGTSWYPEHWCKDHAFVLRQDKDFYVTGISDTLPSLRGSLPVFVKMPVKSADNVRMAEEGIAILKRSLPVLESYLGAYPCDELAIDAFQNDAQGSPGYIMIGGDGGINDWWLLNHELTHSYFHSYVAASWLDEAAANVIPYVNTFDQIASGVTTKDAAFGFDRHPFFSLINYLWRKKLAEGSGTLNQMKENGVNVTTPICQADTSYLAGGALGTNLSHNLIVKIGKRNYLRGMATLYARYRATHTKAAYQDIYSVFLAFTPPERLAEMRSYLSSKFCVPAS